MRIVAAFAYALMLICLGVGPGHAEKRVALVIGNKDYRSGVGPLANTLNDIRIVGDALKSVGFDVLPPVQNATRTDMLRAIYEFASKLKAAGPDAVGFLYYSGHGIASAGENYLIPVDIDEPSTVLLSIQGVKQSEVLAILRNDAPNAAHYLVLDACRNTLRGARGAKGFVPVGQQNGVLVAFSTEPGKTALDTGQGSGPYAAALAAELVKPGQNDLLMFHNVRVDVMDKTSGDQIPWTEDGIQRRKRPLFAGETPTQQQQQQIAAVVPPVVPPAPAGPCGGVIVASISSRAGQPLSANEECALKPKDVFKECDKCPEMVVVPSGRFTMGSVASEEGRFGDEGPQHSVTLPSRFAVGRFAVTFDEWDACVADGDCDGYKPEDRGWGRGRQPVINVSWDDAKTYVAWLSGKTGKPYRLLSEAEREYTARAGTTTPFWWGASISQSRANYSGTKTVPVDSFQPNPWGLYQVNGNVWDWVEDCWHGSYAGAPTDGSAWISGDCSSRVLRGGSLDFPPRDLRAARRYRHTSEFRNDLIGFRLARTLTP
ncbi:MAG: SUMF1/EgtB/PvdO family nonheme iron enzyme [Xanthobacteraceae bacterium]